MPLAPCPICRRPSQPFDPGRDLKVSCAACGPFTITSTAANSWEGTFASLNPVQMASACSWVRENGPLTITSAEIPLLRDLVRPTLGERAVKLLQTIAKASPRFGEPIEAQMPAWVAASWSIDEDETYTLLLRYLQDMKGWVEKKGGGTTISSAGYDYLDELRRGAPPSEPVGFCAMWFGAEVTPAWSNAIKPAIENAGYEARRIDGVEHNNRIDDEIMAHIRRSRFVVADFTGQRGGVYFEAGFALGLGRPVIWTIREDQLQDVHFDNRQYNFLIWKPANLEEFRVRLQNRVEATIGRGPIRR